MVAIVILNVVLDSAIHLYRSGRAPFADPGVTGSEVAISRTET
jgi:hypothetical protein